MKTRTVKVYLVVDENNVVVDVTSTRKSARIMRWDETDKILQFEVALDNGKVVR